jgi:hypothetical protein
VVRLTRAGAAVSGLVVGCIVAAMTARGTCRDGRGALVLSRCWHRPPATTVNFVGSCEAGVACPAVRALACDQRPGVQPTTHTWNSWRRADAVSPPMHLSAPAARRVGATPHAGPAPSWSATDCALTATPSRALLPGQIVAVAHRNNGSQGLAPGTHSAQHPAPSTSTQAQPEAHVPAPQNHTRHCVNQGQVGTYAAAKPTVCLPSLPAITACPSHAVAGPTAGVAFKAGRHPETLSKS